MEALLVSLVAVAIAEIGDKTQLLALMLATRYKAPLPILAGIALSTVANHALAGVGGMLVANWMGPTVLRWVIGIGFLGMAGWTLIPDKADDEGLRPGGAFMATLGSFFMAEMGDKTQIATIGMAASFPGSTVLVVTGSSLGLMLANAPVVLLGDRLARSFDLGWVRFVAAALFAVFGVVVLIWGIRLPE